MGASYYARWISTVSLPDLPDQVVPHVLAEGYELLSHDKGRQIFDRGGVLKKISWSLNGGHWSDAPVDLTITYAHTRGKTTADFRWSLGVRPLPTTHKEQASFEAWIRTQFSRVLEGLGEEPDISCTDTPAGELIKTHDDSTNGHPAAWEHLGLQPIGTDVAMLVRPACKRTKVQYASTYIEQSPHCQRCWKPAVAIPGTTGRYYCLTCHRHLPRRSTFQLQ
jgi:hypothetical protein